jgi:hypothetical protein
MFEWCPCVRRLSTGLARLVLAAVTLSAAGCASDAEYRRQVHGQHVYTQQAQAMRGAIAPPRAAEPELEDDGLPPQVAPPVNRARTPDDPREPYSPNYGNPAAARRADAAMSGAAVAYAPRRVATP